MVARESLREGIHPSRDLKRNGSHGSHDGQASSKDKSSPEWDCAGLEQERGMWQQVKSETAAEGRSQAWRAGVYSRCKGKPLECSGQGGDMV